MGADTTLDSVEDVDSEDCNRKEENDGDDEKGNEAEDPGRKGSVACATLRDHGDKNDSNEWACATTTLISACSSDLATLLAARSSDFAKILAVRSSDFAAFLAACSSEFSE